MQTSTEANEGGRQKRHRPANIVASVLCGLAAAVLLAAGLANLFGVPQMVQLFDAIDAGQWFRFVTGLVEILAGLSLLWPRTLPLVALGPAATMTIAVLVHLFGVPSTPVVAVVLLTVVLAVASMRRGRLGMVYAKAGVAA